MEICAYYILLPGENYQKDKRITIDLKYVFYFWDYFSAHNRTNIHILISYVKCILYENQKNILSQNVLTVIIFDLWYYYILPRWKEFVDDSRVVIDAIANQEFFIL